MADKKKYRVLCWGDCEKFPELAALSTDGIPRCYLSFADEELKPAFEGDVVDYIPEQSIEWLLEGGYIQPASEKPPDYSEEEDKKTSAKGGK